MKLFHLAAVIAFLLLGLPGGFAQEEAIEVEIYEVTIEVRQDGFADHKISFIMKSTPQTFKHIVFSKIDNFRYEAGKGICAAQPIVLGTQITCEFNQSSPSLITFFFTSNDVVKKQAGLWFFQSDYRSVYPIRSSTISIKLPEGAILTQGGEIPAFLPSTGETRSDGRKIILIWQRANLIPNEPFAISVLYENVKTLPAVLYQTVIIGIVAVAGIGFYLYWRRKGADSAEKAVLEVLTPEEKRVVELIRGNGGKIIQKKIVQETDFSKAKVSRIVKGLQLRSIISVEPSGRENLLKLRTPAPQGDASKIEPEKIEDQKG